MIDEEQERTSKKLMQLASSSATLIRKVPTALFHFADLSNITFTTTTLVSTWLYQFFSELKRYDAAPSQSFIQNWLGLILLACSAGFAILAKAYNHFKTRDKAGLQGYPAIQSKLYSLFSSAIVYQLLDFATGEGVLTRVSLPGFIAISFFLPLFSYLFYKLSANDIVDDVTFRSIHFIENSEQNFPKYGDTPRAILWANALIGSLNYGFALSIAFWAVNREVDFKTEPLSSWQFAFAILYFLMTAITSSQMSYAPKIFHINAALSKGLRDAAYSYATLSGIGYIGLLYSTECAEPACWQKNHTRALSILFAIYTIMVAVYSACTTLFDYKSHNDNITSIFSSANRCFTKPMESPIPTQRTPLLRSSNELL